MRIMITFSPTQTPSPAGVGGRGQGQKKNSVRVLVSTGPCPFGSTISPQGPQAPSILHSRPCLMPSPTWGVFRIQLQGWAHTGERDSYFLSPAWSMLFCAGSGPSRAARMLSGRGPPRFILRLALRAASCPEPPSGEARGSGRRAERRVAQDSLGVPNGLCSQ